jgi:ATP:ADP antiporter, AAA family
MLDVHVQQDGIFKATVGVVWMPYARMVSLAFIVPVILVYSKLVDVFARHRLLYVVCGAFGTAFVVLAAAVWYQARWQALSHSGPSPWHVVGWVVFVVIEAFGSVTVSLFWSFVAASTRHQSAARGYSLIVTGGQLGAVIGPAVSTLAVVLSLQLLMLMAAAVIFVAIALTFLYMTYIEPPHVRPSPAASDQQQQPDQHDDADSSSDNKATPGFLVGLKLLLAEPYLLGIFGITTIYEVVGTVMDYQMKRLADLHLDKEHYTAFLGKFGVAVNSVSLILALFGTSSLLRKLGLQTCLLIYPFTVTISLLLILLYPQIQVIFWAQVMLKGVSYALNNPAKEILYLPTNPDVKFKVKSWCDMFGGMSKLLRLLLTLVGLLSLLSTIHTHTHNHRGMRGAGRNSLSDTCV